MATGRDILAVAAKEIGYHEGVGKDNKFGRWYGLNNSPWCLMFVLWCYEQAGVKIPFKTASCGTLLRWYKANQPLYDSWKAATNWATYANYIYKASEVTD